MAGLGIGMVLRDLVCRRRSLTSVRCWYREVSQGVGANPVRRSDWLRSSDILNTAPCFQQQRRKPNRPQRGSRINDVSFGPTRLLDSHTRVTVRAWCESGQGMPSCTGPSIFLCVVLAGRTGQYRSVLWSWCVQGVCDAEEWDMTDRVRSSWNSHMPEKMQERF